MTKTIGIIGGGAAGMMAAATLLESEKECEIHLFEKNRHLGAKVLISGGGRCNVTTGLRDKNLLLKKYPRGKNFLKAALSKFTPEHCYNWFEAHGVDLKTEEDLRVFPKSNNGHDIVGVFEKLFDSNRLKLHLKTAISVVEQKDHRFFLTDKEQNTYEVDYLIITTGGNAYRQTGSTGDGYAFAKSLGHSITPLGPSLNSFEIKEAWPKALSGISLENAMLNYKKIKQSGPLLFTHFGISGPAVFAFSADISFEEVSASSPIEISLLPNAQKKFEDYEAEFLTAIKTSGTRQVKTQLQQTLPKRLAESLLSIAKIQANTPLKDLSKDQRKTLSHLLSGDLKLTLIQRRPGDEFVTAGGVSTNEINPQTMESLLTPNLYFAGEIMDVDGVTGGFNLQASWAAGRLAGKSIAKQLI